MVRTPTKVARHLLPGAVRLRDSAALDARRPASISTSTLEPPPSRGYRLRRAPSTSTMSPARHPSTRRRMPADHAEHAIQSERAADPLVIWLLPRGSTSRKLTTGVPLGSTALTGSAPSLPRSSTRLTKPDAFGSPEGDSPDCFFNSITSRRANPDHGSHASLGRGPVDGYADRHPVHPKRRVTRLRAP